jgi:hypothetical protein
MEPPKTIEYPGPIATGCLFSDRLHFSEVKRLVSVGDGFVHAGVRLGGRSGSDSAEMCQAGGSFAPVSKPEVTLCAA